MDIKKTKVKNGTSINQENSAEQNSAEMDACATKVCSGSAALSLKEGGVTDVAQTQPSEKLPSGDGSDKTQESKTEGKNESWANKDGVYSHLKMSVKSANIMVAVCCVIFLALVIVGIIMGGGK